MISVLRWGLIHLIKTHLCNEKSWLMKIHQRKKYVSLWWKLIIVMRTYQSYESEQVEWKFINLIHSSKFHENSLKLWIFISMTKIHPHWKMIKLMKICRWWRFTTVMIFITFMILGLLIDPTNLTNLISSQISGWVSYRK